MAPSQIEPPTPPVRLEGPLHDLLPAPAAVRRRAKAILVLVGVVDLAKHRASARRLDRRLPDRFAT